MGFLLHFGHRKLLKLPLIIVATTFAGQPHTEERIHAINCRPSLTAAYTHRKKKAYRKCVTNGDFKL